MSIFVRGEYFIQHPGRVLGVEYPAKDQYGKPTIEVRGKLADAIADIGVDPLPIQPYVLKPLVNPANAVSDSESKLKKALAKTKAQSTSPISMEGFDLMPFDEVLKGSRGNMSEDEVAAWVHYQTGRLFNKSVISNSHNGWSKYVRESVDPRWVEQGIVAYDGKEYIPNAIYYAGNIYVKIRDLKAKAERIISAIGQSAYDKQLARLEKAKPAQLRLSGPVSERLHLSAFDPFCKTFKIDRLADGNVFDTALDIVAAFEKYVDELPSSDFKFGSGRFDVWSLWVQNAENRSKADKVVWASRKRKAAQDGAVTFARFLAEGLTREDQQKLEHLWNAEFNFWTEYDFKRIPLGFAVNRYFKNAPLEIRDVQADGVKFALVNGASCNAYDVGLGKTMTAILTMAQGLYTGQCRRPIVVVPGPTYKKWVAEIIGKYDKQGKLVSHGILPQYKDRINAWGNLGVDVIRKGLKEVEDGTITVLTYEGLEKLGMTERFAETLRDELGVILSQGGDGKDTESLKEKLEKNVGNLMAETVVNVDECDFDFFILDEAHNAKNLFNGVKARVTGKLDKDGKAEREQNNYAIGSSNPPSDRALKCFMLSQYVLQNNDMRNVMLLSATPFTNSPLEVYSMLSLVAYQTLKERGLENLVDFFDKFVLVEYEDVVTVKGVENKRVVKAFANRVVLQSIIFSYFNYRSGDDLGEDGKPIVPRPVKVVYPLVKDNNGIPFDENTRVSTALIARPEQAYWLREIAMFARKKPNAVEGYIPEKMYKSGHPRYNKGWDRLLPGRDLMAINFARSVTLSPHLLEMTDESGERVGLDAFQSGIEIEGVFIPDEAAPKENLTAKEYVESSPKLLYTSKCIASVKAHHESRGEAMSGQVIYMNRGVHYFPLVKEYLVDELGFDPKEVAIIAGGIDAKKKERIKELFLSGEIKIIIGSPTIEEGIDLQERSTVLYMLTLPWNPTTIKQIEGRIHRQGNIHTHVRIVNPLLENSIDIFMFQKLEEKTARINSIWSRAGRSNVLKLEEMDPRELKRGLMTDPEMLAEAVVVDETDAAETRATIITEQVKDLRESGRLIETYNDQYDRLIQSEKESQKHLEAVMQSELRAAQDETNNKNERDRATRSAERIGGVLNSERTFKNMAAAIKMSAKIRGDHRAISDIDSFIRTGNKLDAIERNILAPEGLDRTDDFTDLLETMETTMREAHALVTRLKSKEYMAELVQRFTDEMAEAVAARRDVNDRVAEFEKHNHLLSCISKEMECTLDKAGIPKMVVVKKPGANDAPRTDSPAAEPKRTLTKEQRIRLMKARALAYLLLNQAA